MTPRHAAVAVRAGDVGCRTAAHHRARDAALLGTILLVRHWSVGKSELAVEPEPNSEMAALRDRIRQETGNEGGY